MLKLYFHFLTTTVIALMVKATRTVLTDCVLVVCTVLTSDIESQHQSIRLLFYMNVLNGYSLLIVSQCSGISHSLLHEVRPPLICCLFCLFSHILGVGLAIYFCWLSVFYSFSLRYCHCLFIVPLLSMFLCLKLSLLWFSFSVGNVFFVLCTMVLSTGLKDCYKGPAYIKAAWPVMTCSILLVSEISNAMKLKQNMARIALLIYSNIT